MLCYLKYEILLNTNTNSISIRILIPLRLYILQKKSLQLMYFLNQNTHTDPLCKDLNILKSHDKTVLENYFY